MANRYPMRKRTYHTGKKKCRYLKELRALRKTGEVDNHGNYHAKGDVDTLPVERNKNNKKPSSKKRTPRHYRDHRGRMVLNN